MESWNAHRDRLTRALFREKLADRPLPNHPSDASYPCIDQPVETATKQRQTDDIAIIQ